MFIDLRVAYAIYNTTFKSLISKNTTEEIFDC